MVTLLLPKVIAKRRAWKGPMRSPAWRVFPAASTFSPARRQTYTGAVATSVRRTRLGAGGLGLAFFLAGAVLVLAVVVTGAGPPSLLLSSPPTCPMAISPPISSNTTSATATSRIAPGGRRRFWRARGGGRGGGRRPEAPG